MKNLFYAILLLLCITGELAHLAYMLCYEHDSIELTYDFKGENECEESKDLEEDASEIPSLHILLDHFSNDNIYLTNAAPTFNDDKFDRVATPPPDFL